MYTKESYNLEFKEEVSKTFLKTVSAYANYNDGAIIFGLDDDANVVGVKESPKEEALRIENMINDSLSPVPYFEMIIKEVEGKTIIILEVKKGKDTPYYYKGKAYKRGDTATIEVDRFELRRLALEGINMHYEDRKSSSQDLRFTILEARLKKEAGIERINLDILKTLNLYHKDGYYNTAGELLADENDIDFSGIDIVKFGKDINKILYRKTISNVSLLTQFDSAVDIFEQYYIFEEIDGYNRIKKELIPREAFRESLANAIVHRVWDTNAYIQIAMYEDKIEINSPGVELSRKEIDLKTGFNKVKTLRILNSLVDKNIISKTGSGVTLTYKLK